MAWATRDQARAHWPDSESIPDDTLDTLLDVSTIQCEQYAPALVTVTKPAALTVDTTLALALLDWGRFTEYDVGALVTGDGIAPAPPGAKTSISAVNAEGTEATLSRAAVATVDSDLVLQRVIPSAWMLACVYQAREVYAAGQREGDVIGLGDFAIRARPLTGTVRSLLRPESDPFVVA